MEAPDKYIRYDGITANDFKNELYDKEYASSIQDKEDFWTKQAEEVVWMKKFTKVVDTSHQYLHRWYTDGEMNICYNAVDRHVDEGRGDKVAFIYDSAYTGVQQQFTYREVQKAVA